MLSIYLAMVDNPGDKEKVTQLYSTYKDMMFYTAMKILHDTALSEDAVHDSFLKIIANISKFSSLVCSETASYIVIIVRNTCYDYLRKEKPGSSVPFDEAIETEHLQMPDITEVLSGGIGNVMEIISSMDKLYSDVLKLKYIYGYSNAEISKLLDISTKNTEMRLYRAKLILKNKLEEKGYAIKRKGK